MSASQLKKLKELENENAPLKKMYADLSLVHHALKDAVEKSSKACRQENSGEIHGHNCGQWIHLSGLPLSHDRIYAFTGKIPVYHRTRYQGPGPDLAHEGTGSSFDRIDSTLVAR